MEVLAKYVRECFGSGVKDCRHIPGHGADAKDEQGRFFELKAYGAAAPDQVTLTKHEFARATEMRENYYLVVVGGLDEGFETTLTAIADPLGKLVIAPVRDLVLSGVSAHPLLRFAEDGDGTETQS